MNQLLIVNDRIKSFDQYINGTTRYVTYSDTADIQVLRNTLIALNETWTSIGFVFYDNGQDTMLALNASFITMKDIYVKTETIVQYTNLGFLDPVIKTKYSIIDKPINLTNTPVYIFIQYLVSQGAENIDFIAYDLNQYTMWQKYFLYLQSSFPFVGIGASLDGWNLEILGRNIKDIYLTNPTTIPDHHLVQNDPDTDFVNAFNAMYNSTGTSGGVGRLLYDGTYTLNGDVILRDNCIQSALSFPANRIFNGNGHSITIPDDKINFYFRRLFKSNQSVYINNLHLRTDSIVWYDDVLYVGGGWYFIRTCINRRCQYINQ